MTPSAALEHVLREIELAPPITVEDCEGLRDMLRELIGDTRVYVEAYVTGSTLVLRVIPDPTETVFKQVVRTVNLL